MNDQDLKKLFKNHKIDIPDDGFSERVFRELPEQRSILTSLRTLPLSQIIMITFITIGFVLVFVLQGFAPIFEQLNQLTTSIPEMDISALPAILITLIIWIFLLGTVGFSVASVSEK
ncbi:MAG: DUF5056 domain-containing protein [Bacteroidales bacterium]|nr:DUF5056 domain-containing protein [Bacteroidales bacterium]